MASQFNLAQFKQEFHLKETARDLVTALTTAVPALQDNEQLQNIMARLQIAPAEEAQVFVFGLQNNWSIEDAQRDCINHNAQFFHNIQTKIGRAYYNTDRTGMDDPNSHWRELSRPEAAEYKELNKLMSWTMRAEQWTGHNHCPS